MKLNVFGRPLEVIKEDGEWSIYVPGEGKRTKSSHIVIPSHYNRDEVLVYLGDMYHEAASPENPDITVVEE